MMAASYDDTDIEEEQEDWQFECSEFDERPDNFDTEWTTVDKRPSKEQRHKLAIVDELRGCNFIKLYKGFIGYKGLKLNHAVMMSFILDFYSYHLQRYTVDWFYCRVEQLERESGLCQKTQWNLLQQLQQAGILKTKYKGYPKKRYIRINVETLFKVRDLYQKRRLCSK